MCIRDRYLGIVGPVRVGKSTFIKKFMEQAVIPYVEDEYEKGRMICLLYTSRDDLRQPVGAVNQIKPALVF